MRPAIGKQVVEPIQVVTALRGHSQAAKRFEQAARKTVGFQREYYQLMAKWHEQQAKGK